MGRTVGTAARRFRGPSVVKVARYRTPDHDHADDLHAVIDADTELAPLWRAVMEATGQRQWYLAP